MEDNPPPPPWGGVRLVLHPFAENIGKRVFFGKIPGSEGECREVQGNEQEVEMTGKQGELKGKRRGTEREMRGKRLRTSGVKEDTKGHEGRCREMTEKMRGK